MLQKAKLNIQAEVFSALRGDKVAVAKTPPHEVVVVNELIREYLAYAGYSNTKSIFERECETASSEDASTTRELLKANLKINVSDEKTPLLFSLLFGKEKKQLNF